MVKCIKDNDYTHIYVRRVDQYLWWNKQIKQMTSSQTSNFACRQQTRPAVSTIVILIIRTYQALTLWASNSGLKHHMKLSSQLGEKIFQLSITTKERNKIDNQIYKSSNIDQPCSISYNYNASYNPRFYFRFLKWTIGLLSFSFW